MANIPMFDPLTSEARSPLIAGLTEACSKLSSILDMQVGEAYDFQLIPIYVSKEDQYRIYQAPLGNKLWLETPRPVIRQNGIVITPEDDGFTIDYFGGSIVFDNNRQLTENDIVTADFTYVVDRSYTLQNIYEEIEAVGINANKFRGYYTSSEYAFSAIENPIVGDFFIIGGEEDNIYIWDSTDNKWEPVFRETDLSDYYDKSETDELLNQKEDNILAHGGTPDDDGYYYGGRKTWVNLNEKVKDSTLGGLDTSNDDKITEDDNVLSAVGKLQGQINNYVHDLFGEANPTITTVGEIGQDYTNTSTGEKFHLTEITSNGDYIWTQYQEKLDMDDTPTSGSDKPVTSDGIYEALQGKTDKVIPTNVGNLVTLDANGNIVDSGKGVDDVGKIPYIDEIIIPATGWVTGDEYDTQEVTVNGVIADTTMQIIRTSPKADDLENLEAVINSRVYCTDQKNNALVFTAYGGAPEIDIVFNIEIQNI